MQLIPPLNVKVSKILRYYTVYSFSSITQITMFRHRHRCHHIAFYASAHQVVQQQSAKKGDLKKRHVGIPF